MLILIITSVILSLATIGLLDLFLLFDYYLENYLNENTTVEIPTEVPQQLITDELSTAGSQLILVNETSIIDVSQLVPVNQVPIAEIVNISPVPVSTDIVGICLYVGVVIINFVFLHPELFLSVVPYSVYDSVFSFIYKTILSFWNYIVNIIKKFYK